MTITAPANYADPLDPSSLMPFETVCPDCRLSFHRPLGACPNCPEDPK